MFDYIDHCFPSDTHHKLVVHFRINDIGFAERSVDARMIGEMAAGRKALESGSVEKIIEANAGGPYGSAQLQGVLEASDEVIDKVFAGETDHGDWFKARIIVEAHEERPWAVKSVGDGSKSVFEFEKR